MSNYKHFPIAVDKESNKIIHINDVLENGLACNCYCAGCEGDLIAVKNGVKQRPHFRHNVEANCSFINNFENYVHWLAKGLISTFDTIKLPAIKILGLDLDRSVYKNLKFKIEARLKEEGIFDDINPNEINPNTIVLQNESTIQIEKCEVEKNVYASNEYIRPDVIIYSKGKQLFIEPFWSNKIDSIKLQKIRELDTSTVSIDLFSFVEINGHDFTIERLGDFLKNDTKNKKWIYVKKSKLDRLFEKIFNDSFESKLSILKENIIKCRLIEKEISEKKEIINQLQTEVWNLVDSLPKKSISNLFEI